MKTPEPAGLVKKSLPSHLIYGVLQTEKKKLKRRKSSNQFGVSKTVSKSKGYGWNKSYMSTISKSPVRARFKTPNKLSSSFMNKSQMSKFGSNKGGGIYSQKSFGFRS
jgi:hypothetical protein